MIDASTIATLEALRKTVESTTKWRTGTGRGDPMYQGRYAIIAKHSDHEAVIMQSNYGLDPEGDYAALAVAAVNALPALLQSARDAARWREALNQAALDLGNCAAMAMLGESLPYSLVAAMDQQARRALTEPPAQGGDK